MSENKKRVLTVGGAAISALSIALALLAFVCVNVSAATGTGMPAVSDIIPGEDGTSALTLPEGGNVDSDDVLTPDDTSRTPATILPEPTTRPDVTNTPGATSGPDGTDTGMTDEDGGGILGAIIAVIVVVAIILVVIALIPRKKN
ncbi:MAG: hypothetical protein IJD70_05415 [Clostridia bacterium]|nr:hypothetical protein [Clostridia bacterium]